MAWLKSSDDSMLNPRVLAPLAWQKGPDDDLDGWDLRLPALAGLAWLCATYSAGQETDYVVPDATVALFGGPQWQRLAEWAARAGYWTRVDGGWLLADDSEHLFHIRLKAEIAWERQRKTDNGNPALTIPVRLRDGDGCRYCGRVVNWKARKGGLAGTYDHRTPGRGAQGPDDLVVACGQCNSQRGRDAHPERWHLLPAPVQPYYGEITVTHLAEHGFDVPLSTGPRPAGLSGGPRVNDTRPGDQPDPAPQQHPRRPGTRPDPATGDPAPSRTTPTRRDPATSRTPHTSATPPAGHRAGTTSATPAPGHRALRDAAGSRTPRSTPAQDQPICRSSADPAEPEPSESGKAGSGRDGSGAPPRPSSHRKRGRRGRRGRTSPPTDPPGKEQQP